MAYYCNSFSRRILSEKVGIVEQLNFSIGTYLMKTYFRKTFFKLAGLGVVLSFISIITAGCNTVKGAGQDIQAGGRAIAQTAQKTSESL